MVEDHNVTEIQKGSADELVSPSNTEFHSDQINSADCELDGIEMVKAVVTLVATDLMAANGCSMGMIW